MRLWHKVMVVVVVCCVACAALAWFWLSSHATRIVDRAVSSFTKDDIQVLEAHPVFPCGIKVTGLSVGRQFRARALRLDVDPWKILRRQIRITAVFLDGAELFWDKGPAGSASFLPVGKASAGRVSARPLQVIVKKVVIRDGAVHITGLSGKDTIVGHIEAELTDVPLSGQAVRTEFSATASLEQLDIPFVGNFLRAKGWLNWAERSMEAEVKAIDDNGRAGLEFALVSVNNELAVQGTLRLSGDQQPQALGRRAGVVENVVLGALDSTDSDVEARFSFRTKMDQPRIDQVQLAGNITTGLNSSDLSGNIVESLRGVAEEFLRTDAKSDRLTIE